MKIIKTKVYTYDELKTESAKNKAIEWGRMGAAVDDWWTDIYSEAKELGCKITGFNTGRSQSIDFVLVDSAVEVAFKIVEQHGEDCETHKTAKSFLADRDKLVEKYSDGVELDTVTEENEYDFDEECDELEQEFCKSLGNDYLKILERDFEYLTSEETIIETLQANEYTFTADGKRFG